MEGQASYTNDGINIETSESAAVRAVFNGQVRAVDVQLGRYYVLIKHGEYFTVYQNLKSVSVAKGDNVTTKQTIGVVANTEGTPQLQFQIRRGAAAQNPEAWIAK
jgi:murein hydrolase activator